MAGSVTIFEHGRDGSVAYFEGGRTITGYWEFGGNDVVTIVSMGTADEWASAHAWALGRRDEILKRVADEVIRQRAPTCIAEIDDKRGDILLRLRNGASTTTGSTPETPRAKAAAFVHRFTQLKAKMGLVLLVVVVVIGAVMLLARSPLSIAAPGGGGGGIPLNDAMRTDTHVFSLIQTRRRTSLDISGRGGNDETSVSVLLIPLDGGAPRVVPVTREISNGSLNLARIMGSDGRTLWLDAGGLYGVRLSDYRLVTPDDLRRANPQLDPTWWDDQRGMDVIDGKLHVMRIDRSEAMDIDPVTLKGVAAAPNPSNKRFERHDVGDHLAAGLLIASDKWLGLHSDKDLQGGFATGKWVRPVESADDARLPRRLYSSALEASDDGDHFRIRGMKPVGETEYRAAAFLRPGSTAQPVRLKSPESALIAYTTSPAMGATLSVARIGLDGKAIWSVDTGIERFKLQQIMPGADSFVFIGTRPPIPDKLSEPIAVIIDNTTGKVTTHSLWR